MHKMTLEHQRVEYELIFISKLIEVSIRIIELQGLYVPLSVCIKFRNKYCRQNYLVGDAKSLLRSL
jgi:hypothetical protein